jgi:hypothetical protein
MIHTARQLKALVRNRSNSDIVSHPKEVHEDDRMTVS